MRLLYITAFPPNKKTAGQNYSRQLLNDLVTRYCVDLIYWDYPEHEIEISKDIKILKKFHVNGTFSQLIAALRLFPFFSKRYSKSIAYYIQSIAKFYDVIYFDFSQIFIYSTHITHPFKIGMSHDVIAQKFKRNRIFRFFLPWIKKSEYKCLKSFNHIYTFSKKDSNYIKNAYGLTAGTVPFYIEPQILNIKLDRIDIGNYYIMYGAWNRKENQETIDWVLSYKWVNMPYIKVIGGGMPTIYKDKISKYTNIEYCGFIENPYPIIASSRGLLAPLFHGAGVKVKVIESLALGTPIIGNDITFEGIDHVPFRGKGALISINSNDLNKTVEELKTITSLEKESIREQFLSIYNSTNFIDQLKRLKN